MLNPKALALAVLATGAGAVVFLSSGQAPASPAPAGLGPVPVAIPPGVTEVPSAHPAIPAAERVPAPSSTPSVPAARPAPTRLPVASTPTRKAAPAPKRTSAPTPKVASAPPAYSEVDLGGGWSAYCSNGYLQPDGSCSSRPEGYHPAPAPASDPCSGTGTECLNATLGQLGIYNGIPGLMGGR